MAIAINHSTKVISIPKSDTTFVETNSTTGYEVRSYDEYAFMRELADYLDSEAGAALPNAFSHNTSVTISGVVYARSLSILSPYTLTFENGSYQVKLIGGMNNNILDVLNPNSVSVIPANSAGLQTVNTGGGSGASAAEVWAYSSRTLSTTPPTAADTATAVWAKALEGLTAEEMMRIMLAALAGKRAGLGGVTEYYMAQDDITPRITLTADANGNGDAVLNGAL